MMGVVAMLCAPVLFLQVLSLLFLELLVDILPAHTHE